MAEKVLLDEEIKIPELPSLDDITHPTLKRAIKRVQEMLNEDGTKSGYNKHHNRHDRSGSPYW